MRKLLILLLVFLSICPAARAAEEKYAALTFDDGPSGRFTRALLEGLRERDVPATFFLCGYRMEQYPDIVKTIWEDGHEIGLHGYSHNCMGTMCRAQIDRELMDCRMLLPEGCEAGLLRPPGGKQSAVLRRAAEEAGLSLVFWDVDPRDWATHRAEQVEEAVIRKVSDGDLILLHDMSDSSVEAALAIVDALKREGYTFLTVSQLAALRETPLLPGDSYSRFPPT